MNTSDQFLLDENQPIYQTSENVTKRLAMKAGITIVSDNSRIPILMVALKVMIFVFNKAAIYAESQGKIRAGDRRDEKRVIKLRHIEHVLRDLSGDKLFVLPVNKPCEPFKAPKAIKVPEGEDARRRKAGAVTKRAITYYQNQSDCYYIPRSYFLEQIREIRDNAFIQNMMISGDAVDQLQSIVENITINNLIVSKKLLDILGKEKLTADIFHDTSVLIDQVRSLML